MITNENRSKLPQRIGDRGLDKILKNGSPKQKPAEMPATWIAPEAVSVGVQGRDGFKVMHNATILKMSREYRRRFPAPGEHGFCETVLAVRTVMWRRLKTDFPNCVFSIDIIQPNGDFCVSVDAGEGEYLSDSRVLQARLDDACARFAECLGV